MIGINSEDDFGIKTTSIRSMTKMIYQGIKCGCGKNSGFPHGDANYQIVDKAVVCNSCGRSIFDRVPCLQSEE